MIVLQQLFFFFIENTVVTVTESQVLVTSVDENGFEVSDEVFEFSNISPLSADSALTFELKNVNILCLGKSMYRYNPKGKKWTELCQEMTQDRVGAASLTFENKVLIFGGCLNGKCSNTIDVMSSNLTVRSTGATLPFPLMFHSVTKISNYELILCGGQNSAGIPVPDVYFGAFWLSQLRDDPDTWEIYWVRLPNLNIRRWSHTAFYIQNRLIVAGGSSQIHRWLSEVGAVGSTILRQHEMLETEDLAGEDVEQFKLKKSYNLTNNLQFVRNDGNIAYLPFSIPRKGWKKCKVICLSI